LKYMATKIFLIKSCYRGQHSGSHNGNNSQTFLVLEAKFKLELLAPHKN